MSELVSFSSRLDYYYDDKSCVRIGNRDWENRDKFRNFTMQYKSDADHFWPWVCYPSSSICM